MPALKFFDVLAQAKGKRVAVVGDYMLDRHLVGSVRRISPEAPVPVVEIEDERSSLGGAGNVVANLASLGIQPVAFGVSGKDKASELMREHLSGFGCDCGGLLELADRKTTEKIRVIAHDQHIVRVDRETTALLETQNTKSLLGSFESFLSSLDGVILQDYNKGVLTSAVIEGALKMAGRRGLPVYVDPKFDNFLLYQNVHLFKPNLRETERALGLKIEDDESLSVALERLQKELSPDVLMVTRGERGMTICTREKTTSIPTNARDVADVSGAGDTVISTFVACELGGADVVQAATLANIAAGIVCEQVGVVPIDSNRLASAYDRFE